MPRKRKRDHPLAGKVITLTGLKDVEEAAGLSDFVQRVVDQKAKNAARCKCWTPYRDVLTTGVQQHLHLLAGDREAARKGRRAILEAEEALDDCIRDCGKR